MALLYTGLDPTHYKTDKEIHHISFIEIQPKSLDTLQMRVLFDSIPEYTHVVFTSRTAVRLFFEALRHFGHSLQGQEGIAIGKGTASEMERFGFKPTLVAENETQEGIIRHLAPKDLSRAYFFLPRSSISRPILTHFLMKRDVRHQICDLYDTLHKVPDPLPNLAHYDEIVFTSPSSVDAFMKAYGHLPDHIEIKAIGPITHNHITKFRR